MKIHPCIFCSQNLSILIYGISADSETGALRDLGVSSCQCINQKLNTTESKINYIFYNYQLHEIEIVLTYGAYSAIIRQYYLPHIQYKFFIQSNIFSTPVDLPERIAFHSEIGEVLEFDLDKLLSKIEIIKLLH